MGDQPRAQTHQITRVLRVVRRLQIGVAGRVFGPVRRPHPLDPSALLVDQDWRIRVADRGAQFIRQRPHLIRRVDVAPEQDEAPRLLVAVKGDLVSGQRKPAASEDHSFAIGHGVTLV